MLGLKIYVITFKCREYQIDSRFSYLGLAPSNLPKYKI